MMLPEKFNQLSTVALVFVAVVVCYVSVTHGQTSSTCNATATLASVKNEDGICRSSLYNLLVALQDGYSTAFDHTGFSMCKWKVDFNERGENLSNVCKVAELYVLHDTSEAVSAAMNASCHWLCNTDCDAYSLDVQRPCVNSSADSCTQIDTEPEESDVPCDTTRDPNCMQSGTAESTVCDAHNSLVPSKCIKQIYYFCFKQRAKGLNDFTAAVQNFLC